MYIKCAALVICELNYNGRAPCVSNYFYCCIQLLYDAERDLLATAKFLVMRNHGGCSDCSCAISDVSQSDCTVAENEVSTWVISRAEQPSSIALFAPSTPPLISHSQNVYHDALALCLCQWASSSSSSLWVHSLLHTPLRPAERRVTRIASSNVRYALHTFSDVHSRQQPLGPVRPRINELANKSHTLPYQSSLAELVDSAETTLFFNAFYTIPTTFYTHCYPISTQQDTILDIVVMTEFYLQRPDVCRLITF